MQAGGPVHAHRHVHVWPALRSRIVSCQTECGENEALTRLLQWHGSKSDSPMLATSATSYAKLVVVFQRMAG